MDNITGVCPEISIIIPALNEEKNLAVVIGRTLKSLENFKINGEIVVVNDGSRDGTSDLLKGLAEKDGRVRIVTHERPQGIGASFWDGVDNARANIITWMPGDNENNPCENLRYYKLLADVDVIVPFAFNKEVRSRLRNVVSFIYRFIINTTFMTNFNYTNGTFMLRKSILSEIEYRSRGFFFHTDILIRLAKRGYLFAEVPFKLEARLGGDSKAFSLRSFSRLARDYFILVKDIYFKGNRRVKRFTPDSLSGKRRC